MKFKIKPKINNRLNKIFLRTVVLSITMLFIPLSAISITHALPSQTYGGSKTATPSSSTANSSCSLNNGLCPTCYSSNASNCITPPNNTSTCTTSDCNLISTYVNPAINVLSVIVGLAITASIIWAGIQYSSSDGDPNKISKAKTRITNSILAFLFFIFLYGFLQFIIPGGLFNK